MVEDLFTLEVVSFAHIFRGFLIWWVEVGNCIFLGGTFVSM